MNTIAQQLHSLLVINTGGLEKSKLPELLNVSDKNIETGLVELSEFLKSSGVVLLQTETMVQLAAQTDVLPKELQEELRSEQLSAALLEVLTIVAYHQPITQAEIENMRGIGSEQTIKGLIERNLIEPKLKKVDAISLPHFSTTQAFLAHLGITSLSELPSLPKNKAPNATQ